MPVALAEIDWRPAFRIIPSRYPPIDLFEKVADPADLDAVFALEAMTNQRLRDEVGDISLVPPEDRVSGPGTSAIMAAFTHLRPGGDRFSDGTCGAFYCSDTIDTAIGETAYHREAFMRATAEPAQEIHMRVYAVDLVATLHDIRDLQEQWPEVYASTSYAASQLFARELRQQGSDGLAYSSVRQSGGQCAAIFRPRVLVNCRQERHFGYLWNGCGIVSVIEKNQIE